MRQAVRPPTSLNDIAKRQGGEMPPGWAGVSGPPSALVKAVAQLLSGRLPLSYERYRQTTALILRTPKATFVLKRPSNFIFSTGIAPWDPEVIILCAAALILKPAAIRSAYVRLAAAKTAGDRTKARAAMVALCTLIGADSDFAEPAVYFYLCRGTAEAIVGLDSRYRPADVAPISIGKLFAPAVFPDYAQGKIFPEIRGR